MLRVGQNLMKYAYNGSFISKYNRKVAPEVEKKQFQESFKAGDAPEYIYNANIKFNEEYKPYTANSSHSFIVGVVVVFSYLTYRYETVREQQGKTITHQYAIWSSQISIST